MTEPLACGVFYEEEHRDISYTITGESRENGRNWGVRGTESLAGSFHFAVTLYNKFLVSPATLCAQHKAVLPQPSCCINRCKPQTHALSFQ